jgi:hypothetical protein
MRYVNMQAATPAPAAAALFHAQDCCMSTYTKRRSEPDLDEHQRINFYNAGSTITW